MKQQDLDLNLSTRYTRKAQFLDEMELVVPRRELVTTPSGGPFRRNLDQKETRP